MADIKRIQKTLADVFDYTQDTAIVKKGNRIIFGMILLSVVATFLNTIPSINAKCNVALVFIDILTVLFFTVEYVLRVCLCGVNIEKYRGVKGKLRYVFSFFALIDLLAIAPFYASLITDSAMEWLVIMRILRVFRLFRFLSGYSYIIGAFEKVKDQFYISLEFLVIVTFVLSMILYYVEVDAQPDVYSGGLESLLWAFMQYIGDPGGFANYSPVTMVGRVISVIIGVLGVAIFAIPAGLVGSAFTDAIESKKNDDKVRNNKEILRTAFSRQYIKDQDSYIRVIPTHVYIEDIQARKGLDLKDIQDIIKLQKDENWTERYRLKDISKSVSSSNLYVSHQLVVEHYICNRSYGYFHKEVGSKVTIVANVHRSSANLYAFYLAKLGGFNVVIKEEDPSPAYPSSWVSLQEDLSSAADEICGIKTANHNEESVAKERESQETEVFREFIEDIHSCRCEGGLLVVLNAAEDESKEGVERKAEAHIVYGNKIGANDYDPESQNISNPEQIDRITESFKKVVKERFDINVVRNDYFRILKNNLVHHVWGNAKNYDINKIVVKLNKELVVWDSRCILVIKELSNILAREVDGREIEIGGEMKSKRLGYDGLI